MHGHQYGSRIKRILTNDFTDCDPLSKEQLKTLNKYAEWYSAKKSNRGGRIKPASVENALNSLRELGLYLGKPYKEATKNDLVKFFLKHKKGKSESSINISKVYIRSFYKWLYGMRKKHEYPECVDDERLEPSRSKPRKVSPSDLFTKNDMIKMLNACRNPMDKAIVSIWFEMGLRANEYVSADVGSVEFVSGGCKFYVEESKTETGFVPLIQSAPYLQDWLQVHPFGNDPKAPLFLSIHKYNGNRLWPNSINLKLKRIAKRAGIKKRIYTHLGRNISITRLDGTMSVEDNARLHGITPATVLNVYTKRSRKEAVKKYFDTYGREKTDQEKIKEKEEKEKLLPKKCENCSTLNPYDRNYCKKCLRPIDLKTFLELENKREIRDKTMIKTAEKGLVINEETIKEVVKEMIRNGEIKV